MKKLEISIDGNLYSEVVVTKCLYWLTGKYSIDIVLSDNNYNVSISKLDRDEISESEENEINSKISRDLIDFKLREVINTETHNIRELIIAKAFSHGEFDENPPGSVEDPVGFNIDE